MFDKILTMIKMEKHAERKNMNEPLLVNKGVCYSQNKKRTKTFDSVLRLQPNFAETSCIYLLKGKVWLRWSLTLKILLDQPNGAETWKRILKSILELASALFHMRNLFPIGGSQNKFQSKSCLFRALKTNPVALCFSYFKLG